jgi:oligogalacturonide transport system ATP-binding protein
MAEVIFNKLEKVYSNGFKAVHGIDLKIADGEFMVIVGPSGCAKSTTLRMLAGLETISGGEVRIGDKIVNNLAPKSRGIAMVFQNYALYPHMTVRENLAFGLKLSKLPKAQIDARWKKRRKSSNWKSCSIACRASSPAARRSAWRWAGRSSKNRTCSCSMNRSPTLTPSCAPRCASAFPICISS